MPTKTNKSPLHISPGMIMTIGKGMLGVSASNLSNMPTEFKQIREEGKGNRSFGGFLKGTGRLLLTSGQSTISGLSKSTLGTDFGLGQKGYLADNTPKTPQEEAAESAKKYSTNIDLYGEENLPNQDLVNPTGTSNITNTKPFKQLTQNEGNTAKNMSAFRYKSGLKMSVISGSSSLPMRSSLKMEDLSGDGKTTMKDVLIGRGVIDKEGNKIK